MRRTILIGGLVLLAIGGLAWWASAQQTAPDGPAYSVPIFFSNELPANCREHAVERRREFARDSRTAYDIVFVGDSLVENWSPLPLAQSHHAANRGIGCDSTNGLHERLARDVIAYHPRAAVVLIGVNDIYLLAWLGRADRVHRTAMNIVAIAQRLQGHGVRPLIVLPLPVRAPITGESTELSNAMIGDLNAELTKLLPLSNADFVDASAALGDEHHALRPEFTPDGLHLSPAGYAVLNRLVEPQLEKLMR
jgi:lysophospholipase L1-like esterase